MGLLKAIHIASVLISISGFMLRGIWMMLDSPRLQQRWVKIVPHVNDTILLATGITLAISIQQYPFVHGWLTAKVVALLAYIGLGMVALRFGKTKQQKIIAWVVALLVFAYMLGVARTHQAFLF